MNTQNLKLGIGCGRHPHRVNVPMNGSRANVAPGETLIDAITHWERHAADRPLVYCLGERDSLEILSAHDLMNRARAIAAKLAQRGISAGNSVILALDTSTTLVAAFIGCMLIGAIPSVTDLPFSMRSTAGWSEKLGARIRLLQTRVVLISPELLPIAQNLGPDGSMLLTPADLEDDDQSTISQFTAQPNDIAFAQFTSGTISAGRAIRLSHRAVMANLRAMAAQRNWMNTDLLVSWLPLYHDLGLVANLLLCLALGVPIVLMSPLQFLFQPSRWLWSIHHFRANIVYAPNFAYEMCAKRIDQDELEGLDLSSLHDVFNCAEFVHASTLQRFSERYSAYGFTHDAWVPAYGMAEIVVGASIREQNAPLRIDRISRKELVLGRRAVPLEANDPDFMEIVSCGSIVQGMSFRIVDEHGNELPDRMEGSIEITGPSLFDGYHGEPEATANVLRNGWLVTGDLGYRVDNELYICGRSKDLIIKGGENYHPYAFERAVAEVKGVRAGGIAAIGITNVERGTEDLVIVFETEEKDSARVRAICTQIERDLHIKFGIRPDRVVPVPIRTIPKTTSGKIRRRALAESLDSLQT